MDITWSFPLFLFVISIASPFGIPLGETFFIISAGSLSGTFPDYFFFVTLIYGALSVFFSRFLLLWLSAPVNYLSGFSKYSFRKFFVSAASGEFLYAAIYAYIGFAFKDSWGSIFDVIVDFSFTIILILAGLFALFLLKKYLISDRKRSS